MESLLHKLHERMQLQQHMYSNDLANMENVNDKPPPQPPPHKYVSIFRINGEPILPPLMTTEKRRQMQNFKEKALKIEQRLKERKQEYRDEEKSQSLHNQSTGSVSQRSQDNSEHKLEESEESIAFLKKLIQRHQGGTEEKSTETMNISSESFYRNDNQAKVQKLQKSEILIYDNSMNEVIQLPADKEKNMFASRQKQSKEASFTAVPNQRSTHLLLEGVNSKGMTAIPSICLNPPTPLTVNKTLCETVSGSESDDSFLNSENLNQALNFSQDLSSDDSFNSMITQSDMKSNRNMHQSNAVIVVKAKKSTNVERVPEKNVCAKIQQFEAISSETNSPQTSPEKLYKNRKVSLGTPTGTMNRSATSPSIKITTSNRSSSSRSQNFAKDSDNSPENSLVRSSSFTLEGPSEVLIEHMQQQKFINNNNDAVKSPINATQSLSRKTLSTPLRAHMDTIESKAKRVQKVELKSSKQKIQQKISQTKLAQVAATSIPYSITANQTQHVNNLYKTKRSPYDVAKTSHTSIQTSQKTSSTQMRKSNSATSNSVLNKSSKSRLTKSSTSTSSNPLRTPQSGKESLNQMDKSQKDKFLLLLAQQEEEHRRLQRSFEMEQKLLIEKLNREMGESQLKSPNNSYHSSSTTPTSVRKRFVQQQILSPRQINQINTSGFSSSHGTQKLTFDLTRQQTSSSISNNSSYLSFDKNQPQTLNSHQHSSHASHYTQLSQSPHLNNSHFPLMDHSNANNSLDISTLSIQSSHDTTPCATPTSRNNNVCNAVGNQTTTSSSRRRLFPTDINDAGGSAPRSPYSSPQCFVDVRNQPQQHNHNDDNNKRAQEESSVTVHAAATKINAYARGFLVRRLFQTEQIQRIVQTIRDTLIFVLNLHIETIENPEEARSPANIKLKARLLQQLSSACRTLHLVFFQTSIKERMEIISRDRKRIKTKLMLMNRKR